MGNLALGPAPAGSGSSVFSMVPSRKAALLILAGLTANAAKLEYVRAFFTGRSGYDVYVPNLPKRRSLESCAVWLGRYLDNELDADRYQSLHLLCYISGALVFRRLIAGGYRPLPLDRIVYLRSPNQECAVARFVQRYGRLIALLLKGRLVIDITAEEAGCLPYPESRGGQGLVIESGQSRFARWMGVERKPIVKPNDVDERLLPGASDTIRVPQSHDDIYTSDEVLTLILNFFSTGHFRFRRI